MPTLNTQPHFHDSKLQVLGDFEPGNVFYEALMQAHDTGLFFRRAGSLHCITLCAAGRRHRDGL